MDSWQYTGQAPEEWPLWLRFTNYGWNRETKLLIVPQFEASHRVFPGDWIDRRPDGFLTIRPENNHDAG